jgi:hypothetical protein
MTFHFIITAQFGAARFTWDDIHETKPGETRQDAYRTILDKTRLEVEKRGLTTRPGDFSTLFFSLEPNEIGA